MQSRLTSPNNCAITVLTFTHLHKKKHSLSLSLSPSLSLNLSLPLSLSLSLYHQSTPCILGTAFTEAAEFLDIYQLKVLPIPTALPVARRDNSDAVFRTKEGKLKGGLVNR